MRRPRLRRSIENLGWIHAVWILNIPVSLCMWPIAETTKTRTPTPHTHEPMASMFEVCKTAVMSGM